MSYDRGDQRYLYGQLIVINLIPFLATHLDFYRNIIDAYKTIDLNFTTKIYMFFAEKRQLLKSNILFFFREI